MTVFKYLTEIVLPILTLIGGAWAFFKIFYRFKSKFLFVTNCQLVNVSIWDEISRKYRLKQNGPEDYAFRPLVLLPESLKEYINIKNGHKAVLEMVNPNKESNLKLIAEIYWIPKDMEPWNSINEPVFSKIITRYFGIEMPIYQDETEENVKEKLADWEIVKHSRAHFTATNVILDDKFYKWLMKKQYTFRYFNPYDGKYYSEAESDNFIEYCGLTIKLRSHSIIHIEKA